MNSWPRVHMSAMAMTNPQSKAMRRARVKANKRVLLLVLAVTVVMISVVRPPLPAQTATAKSSPERNSSSTPQWSVQVDTVGAGDANLAPSFEMPIDDSLLDGLGKTKRVKEVLR